MMPLPQRHQRCDAGFSLVEVLVSLAIFALIGTAGFSVLDQVLRSQRQTEGRLDRLATMQRALHLFRLDLMQAEPGTLTFADGAVAFRREAPQEPDGALSVSYRLAQGALVREVAHGAGAETVVQPLLTGITALDWQFLGRGRGWLPDWPPPPAAQPAVTTIGIGSAPATDKTPLAVAMVMQVAPPGPGLSGALRALARLPVDPQ